jgi:FG-GAP-like repeat
VGSRGRDLPLKNIGAYYIVWLKRDGTRLRSKRFNPPTYFPIAAIADHKFGFGLCHVGDVNSESVLSTSLSRFSHSASLTVSSQSPPLFSLSFHSLCLSLLSGVPDIAVGAPGDTGVGRGEVYITFLLPSGDVGNVTKIAEGSGGFSHSLQDGDQFGYRLGCPGDIDQDGVNDLLVSSMGMPQERGRVYVLFLNSNGTVRQSSIIQSSPVMPLPDVPSFGSSLSGIGDLNRDGTLDVAIGMEEDPDGSGPVPGDRGAVWLVFLDRNGTAIQAQKGTHFLSKPSSVLWCWHLSRSLVACPGLFSQCNPGRKQIPHWYGKSLRERHHDN